MLPIRQTVMLRSGAVTLQAWGARAVDSHLLDLLTLTMTLGTLRDDWQEFSRADVEPGIWAAFWRLLNASLLTPQRFPDLGWDDRLTLLNAMWQLNDVEEAEGKLNAVTSRADRVLARLTPSPAQTTAWTST